MPAAKRHGIAAMGVHNSDNAATLGYHTGRLAQEGLLAFGFTNATPAIAPVGGRVAVIGTNPISFAVPGKPGKIALLVDQSSSAIAWAAVKRAAVEGRDIPLGWALDAEGNPTTDPVKGLAGSMAPAGGAQGRVSEVGLTGFQNGDLPLRLRATGKNEPIGDLIIRDAAIVNHGDITRQLLDLASAAESEVAA